MRPDDPNGKQDRPDAGTLALMALAWTLADDRRAERLLSLTGLDGDTLRDGLAERIVQSAVLGFLADHEPDLLACADAIGARPQELIAARETLSR
ncbi:MAG: DUF3572 domain-containing protein [Sphingobium sp.]